MLITILKILHTLCAVYGWEVVNNHVCSGRSMDNPVTQASLPAERFDLRHPCHTLSPETSLVAQMVKHLSTMRETWVWSLGQEDLLEKAMAPHSSILAWRIPWMEEAGGLQSMGSQRVRHDWATSLSFTFQKQPKGLSTDKSLNKMWSIHTIEYFSA